MASSLEDKVVIVTGASAGIGRATARALARAGARLVLTARREDRLETLARELAPSGARVVTVAGDLADEAARHQIVATARGAWGRIDALVNNAGYGQRGPVERVSLEAIRRNFEINVFALLGLTQLVIPLLRANARDDDGVRGRIVNIGSVAGRIARPLTSVYDATKHALEAFSDGLRGELRPWGVKVVLVRPGFITTEFGDAARSASAEALEDAGPYADYLRGFGASHDRLRWLAAGPEAVAAVVERALTVPRPRARYAVPAHATFFLLLKAWLPTRLFDHAVRLR